MSVKDIFQLLIQDYWRNIQERESLIGLSEECNWYDALILQRHFFVDI